MRCRGLPGVANPAFLGGFLFSGLLRVAPYCAPGGIRVVSISPPRPQPHFLALATAPQRFAGLSDRSESSEPDNSIHPTLWKGCSPNFAYCSAPNGCCNT